MPPSVDQTLQKAKSLLKQGKRKEAAELYRSILEKFPHNLRAQEELKALGERVLSNSGPSKKDLDELIALLNAGAPEKALERAETLLKESPESAALLNILGSIYIKMKKPEAALSAYRRACEINPLFFEASLNLGNTLRNLEKYDDAIGAYQKAIEINPNSFHAHHNLGLMLLLQKRFAEALSSLTHVVRLKADYAEAYYHLGIIYSELNRFEDALEAYKKALTINPDYVSCYNNLGSVYFNLSRYEEAIAACQKTL